MKLKNTIPKQLFSVGWEVNDEIMEPQMPEDNGYIFVGLRGEKNVFREIEIFVVAK